MLHIGNSAGVLLNNNHAIRQWSRRPNGNRSDPSFPVLIRGKCLLLPELASRRTGDWRVSALAFQHPMSPETGLTIRDSRLIETEIGTPPSSTSTSGGLPDDLLQQAA